VQRLCQPRCFKKSKVRLYAGKKVKKRRRGGKCVGPDVAQKKKKGAKKETRHSGEPRKVTAKVPEEAFRLSRGGNSYLRKRKER